MRIYVYKRSDESLAIFTAPAESQILPRTWGSVEAKGVYEFDVAALTPFAAERLARDSYTVLIGSDAAQITRLFSPPTPRAPKDAEINKWDRPIG